MIRRGAVVVAAIVALVPLPARANGRFPAASMLVARPGDPSRLVLRATYGLLFSSDGGTTWDWLCEKAVGYRGNEDPSIAVTGSGAVIAGTFGGLARSTDGGCGWQRTAKGPESIVDLAIRPSAPDRVYAVSCLFSRVGDAGAQLFHSELVVSDDAGEHWTTRATLDPTLLIDSVEVSPNDPERVYVSAIRPRGKDTQAVLLVSRDDGARFTERSMPFGASDRGVYIAGVDPTRADRVYFRTSGVDTSRLVVTDDAGKTTRSAFEGGTLLGFALSDDGATIYAGGPKEGLLVASAKDAHFTKRSAEPIQCLAMIGGALWACTPASSGFVLGASTDGGATFTPRLTLAGMRGPLQCAPPRVAAECAADWTALRQLVGLDEAKDAGVPPAPPPPPPAARGCGCEVPRTRTGLGAAPWALLWPALSLARRRKRCAILPDRLRWDPAFFRRSSLFWPIAPAAARLEGHADWPDPSELALLFPPEAGEPPVRFALAPPKPRRGRAAARSPYDARIALDGIVPTRARSWHDLLNALVWATFPRAKRALHARQHRMIAARLGDDHRLPGARTSEQDAVAMLDEGGVVLLRSRGASCAVIFGHAIYEGLACGGPPNVRGAAHVVEVAALPRGPGARVAEADAALARLFARDEPIGRGDLESIVVTEDLAPPGDED